MEKQKKLNSRSLEYIGPLELVLVRNAFYQESYRLTLQLSIALLFFIGFLCFFLHYEKNHSPKPVYFATTNDGAPIRLVPLNQSHLKPALVLAWATEAAVQSYTFNFVDYRVSFQSARNYFTPNGYYNFLSALKASLNLEAVKKQRLVAYAQIQEGSNPTILRDSQSDPTFWINNAFSWEIQVPLIVTYEGEGREKIVQRMIVTLLVTRLSLLDTPYGLGIDSFIARAMT